MVAEGRNWDRDQARKCVEGNFRSQEVVRAVVLCASEVSRNAQNRATLSNSLFDMLSVVSPDVR